jgi:serine/threonine protein kinase
MAHEASINAIKRERTKRLARLGARVYYLRKRGKEQEMYDLICNEFLALGGVYVKFLQGVLFNTPIMKRWHSPNRLRIFENLDSEPLDIVHILREELAPEQLQQIALVQPEPFAAGSFGQVYLAQHANGKHIVIKVLRPMIRELLKYDLRLLGLFSKKFAGQEYDNISIKMSGAIKEFKAATLSETDYVGEAYFARDLYEAYSSQPDIIIPETYLDLCTTHIIVQEYIGGISGAELLRLKEGGTDVEAYVAQQLGSNLPYQLETLGTELVLGAFHLPRIQGDPHPGNIRFLPNNQVGLIDFGISAPSPRNKAAFFGVICEWSHMYNAEGNLAALFEQFMRFFVNDLYRALKKLSTFVARPSFNAGEALGQATGLPNIGSAPIKPGSDLLKEIGSLVQNMFDSAVGTRDIRSILNDGRMLQAFNQMVNRGNRLGLVVRLESSEVLRAAQTYISFLEALNLRSEVLPRMLNNTVQGVMANYPEIANETEKALSTSQAVDIVNRWLERVAVRDPMLFSQLLSAMDIKKAMQNAEEKPTDA